jgi:Na+/H+ antiporter NhaD/arsenite permease-like protein
MILALWPALSADALYALALFSTLAGNLFLVGSLANIIVAQRAAIEGVSLTFADHARAGVPMTLVSMLAATAWLAAVGRLPW